MYDSIVPGGSFYRFLGGVWLEVNLVDATAAEAANSYRWFGDTVPNLGWADLKPSCVENSNILYGSRSFNNLAEYYALNCMVLGSGGDDARAKAQTHHEPLREFGFHKEQAGFVTANDASNIFAEVPCMQPAHLVSMLDPRPPEVGVEFHAENNLMTWVDFFPSFFLFLSLLFFSLLLFPLFRPRLTPGSPAQSSPF